MTMTHETTCPALSPITYTGFEGRAARERLGERASVLLDPEDRTVSVFTAIGAGMPASVWHDRAVSFALPSAASLEAVEACLRDLEGTIEHLFTRYLGKEWDGSNHRGTWKSFDGGDDPRDGELIYLQEACSQVATHWIASDWLAPITHDVAAYVADRVRQGMRPADAIAEVAKNEVEGGLASNEPAILDLDDVETEVARLYGLHVEKILVASSFGASDFDADDIDSIVAWMIGLDLGVAAAAALCLDKDALDAAADVHFAKVSSCS